MYESFYSLTQKPFGLPPDPDFLFWSDAHSSALTALEYGLANEAAIIAITGEVGCGKTIIGQYLLNHVTDQYVTAFLAQTFDSNQSILPWITRGFGLKAESSHDADHTGAITEFARIQFKKGQPCLLIIDEAQNLSLSALEQLRLLSNINIGKDVVLHIMLLGQPELREKLKRRELRQFLQRISFHYRLGPFSRSDTSRYIRHRLSVAGANRELFDDYACGGVHFFTSGVPRLINTLSDHALVRGYAEERKVIDLRTIVEVKDVLGNYGLDFFESVSAQA